MKKIITLINDLIFISFVCALVGGGYEIFLMITRNKFFLNDLNDCLILIFFSIPIYTFLFLILFAIITLLQKIIPFLKIKGSNFILVFFILFIFCLVLANKGKGVSFTNFFITKHLIKSIFLGISGVIIYYVFTKFKTVYSNIFSGSVIIIILLIVFVLSYNLKNQSNNPEDFKVSKTITKRLPNIIYIAVDTLRATHLNQYGYKINTPNIDSLADKSVVFDKLHTPVSVTRPSFTTAFTSKNPFQTGVKLNANIVKQSETTIAEVLKNTGYYTAGFISLFVLHSKYGIAQGFDYYNDNMYPSFIPSLFSARIIPCKLLDNLGIVESDVNMKKAEQVNNNLFKWLKKIPKLEKPLFLFLHYSDPHTPYIPPQPYNKMYDPDYDGSVTGYSYTWNWKNPEKNSNKDIQHIKSLYDGEISYFDENLGKVLRKLEEYGYLDNSIIIFTADHGESFGEHGCWTHGFPYENNLHIPLFIKLPGNKQIHLRISELVRTIDIAPTILDLIGISPPNSFKGKSLLNLIYSKKDDIKRNLPIETTDNPNKILYYGYITDKYKYIYTIKQDGKYEELYDIKKDPLELHNIAKDNYHLLLSLRKNIPFNITKISLNSYNNSYNNIDNMEKEKLKTLGYIK